MKKTIIVLFILTLLLLMGCTQIGDDIQDEQAFFIEIIDYSDLEELIETMAEKDIVLLGESTHGTQEFYEFRRKISKRLIEDHGFDFIAVEGDWHSLYQLNLYSKGLSEKNSAREVLDTFDRWPVWMWANEEIRSLGEWLKEYNTNRPMNEQIGIYGLDVQGPSDSLQFVELMTDERYECFSLFVDDVSSYAEHLYYGNEPCTNEVSQIYNTISTDEQYQEKFDEKELFHLKQSAYVVKNAERQFRAMIDPHMSSWNKRVYHMDETLERLLDKGKGIVWAHNTHVGDARATTMADDGSVNIGQLLREAEKDVFILGFGTYTGEVIAGRSWGTEQETMRIPEAHENSYEYYLESLGMNKSIIMLDHPNLPEELISINNNRAIGVVYNPAHEYPGNYVRTDLSKRYDAFIFIRDTTALQPLS